MSWASVPSTATLTFGAATVPAGLSVAAEVLPVPLPLVLQYANALAPTARVAMPTPAAAIFFLRFTWSPWKSRFLSDGRRFRHSLPADQATSDRPADLRSALFGGQPAPGRP